MLLGRLWVTCKEISSGSLVIERIVRNSHLFFQSIARRSQDPLRSLPIPRKSLSRASQEPPMSRGRSRTENRGSRIKNRGVSRRGLYGRRFHRFPLALTFALAGFLLRKGVPTSTHGTAPTHYIRIPPRTITMSAWCNTHNTFNAAEVRQVSM